MVADPAKINEIMTKGYTIVPGVLSPDAINDLLEEVELLTNSDNEKLKRIESETGKKQIDQNMVLNISVRGRHNAALLENDSLHDYLDILLTNTCILYASQSSSMPPSGTNYSHRIHVDCPRIIPNYITNVGVLFALTDFTLENGATYFLPASQTQAEMPDEKTFEEKAERGVCKAGDMLLFNARIWHRGGINYTDKPRHSIGLNICRSYMRQRFDYPRLIENLKSDVLKYVGDRGKRMLGYNVRMPTSHEEYYVPEEHRLYKSNQG